MSADLDTLVEHARSVLADLGGADDLTEAIEVAFDERASIRDRKRAARRIVKLGEERKAAGPKVRISLPHNGRDSDLRPPGLYDCGNGVELEITETRKESPR